MFIRVIFWALNITTSDGANMKLMILESGAKCNTVKKYLGK